MKVPRGWLPLALLVAGGGTVLTLGPLRPPAVHAQTPTPAAAEGFHIAVVDYQSLLKNHPEFEMLKQLDEQLASLKEDRDLAPLMDQKDARRQLIDKMQKEVEKAKAEMEAEKSRLEGEMAGLSASLQGAMEAELNRVKGGYDSEIEALVDKYRKKMAPPTPASRPDAAVSDSAPVSVSQYQEGLLLVRQRNLTARRLELEKSIRGEIEAERARFDQQMAATEDQIAGKYQEEKLNLQLKLQVTQDEAEQQKLQDRLSAISEEISSQKSARRAELEAGFSEFRNKKNAEFESQLASYKSRLDEEVASKVRGWRPPERPPQQPKPQQPAPAQGPPPAMQKEIEAKIAQARADINAKMAAKKAELEGAMQAKAAQARDQIMAKQAEVQKRLKETEEELKALFEEKKKTLSAKTKQKVAALDKQIEKVQKERDALYDRMIADINKVVAGVAEKKEVPMVIGQVIYNRTCQDLTDFSMVGVKQLGSR